MDHRMKIPGFQKYPLPINAAKLASAVLFLRFGKKPSREEIAYVIWEWTGYPCFFVGNPIDIFERQLWASMIGPHPLESLSQIDSKQI